MSYLENKPVLPSFYTKVDNKSVQKRAESAPKGYIANFYSIYMSHARSTRKKHTKVIIQVNVFPER